MIFTNTIQITLLTIVVIANIFLCLVVFQNNPKSATNRIFTLLGLTMSAWISVYYTSYQPFSPATNLFLIRLSFSFATLMSMLLILLVHTIPSYKLRLTKNKLKALLAATLLVIMATFSSNSVVKVDIINRFPVPTMGPLMLVFTSFIIFSIISTIYLLFTRFKSSWGKQKAQLLFIMFGVILMYGLMITTVLIPVALFNNTTFVSLASFYTLLFIIMTTYAIIKHRLMDIRLVVARAIAYTLLIIILAVIYSGGLFLISSVLFPQVRSGNNQLIVSTLLALFLAFTFQPLLRFLENVTDKIFFKAKYDPQNLLGEIGRIMTATINLSSLTESILKKLILEMKVRKGFIILTRNSSIIWIKGEGQGEHPEFDEVKICNLIDSVVKKDHDNILVFDEMFDSTEKNIMRDHKLSLALPLIVKDQSIGALLLTEKLSGDIFSIDDIDFLKILAPEIAMAVKNALSYEEIKRFNITLEEEVNQATKQLEEANIKLKEIDKLKDEFVSIASHELRTPMTAIKSYLWMALNKSPQVLDSKLKNYLEIAYGATDRLIKLVRDMLTISRIEGNRFDLKMEKISLYELAAQIYNELKITADEKKIEFLLNSPQGDSFVLGDKEKIKEVIENIVGNALKFTPQNGNITISFTKGNSILGVSIKDTGVGISETDLTKLFQKFNRLDNSYAKLNQISGTGLGLYIAKQIITLHKGEIAVESKLGEGSLFKISLPEYIG